MVRYRRTTISAPLIAALFAMLFSLVSAPLSASAMHAAMWSGHSVSGMEHRAPTMSMAPVSMSTEALQETCVGQDCSQPLPCLQHCFERATNAEQTVVAVQGQQIDPSIAVFDRMHWHTEHNERATYVAIDKPPQSSGAIVLTTQKRE